MNRTGTPEEMGVQYEGGDLHESEIKQTTIQVKRRYTELQQLVKYLKKTLVTFVYSFLPAIQIGVSFLNLVSYMI